MKHKLLICMVIGGSAAALNFAPATADSPELGIPGNEVCEAPIDPPTTVEPATTSEPTATPTGIRSNRVVAPEQGLSIPYRIDLRIFGPKNGQPVSKFNQNPCNFAVTLDYRGNDLKKYTLVIPQLRDSGCSVDIYVNNSKEKLPGVVAFSNDTGLVIEFDWDLGKAPFFDVEIKFQCERPYTPKK
jgi:hypothetical protein